MWIRLLPIAACVLAYGCGQDAETTAAEPAASAPAAATAAPAVGPAAAGIVRKPAPAGAVAYIISPADGATVTSPVRVVFGLTGAGVIPAGIPREGAGHHHLLVDADLPDLGLPIPNDANHRHFGGGQTETEIELPAGTHTLQLLLGDELHVPHDPAIMSEQITIEVR